MKFVAVAAVFACSLPVLAQSAVQDSRTGVSNPPPVAAENAQSQATDNAYPDGYRPTPAPTSIRPTTTPSEGRRALKSDVDAQITEPDPNSAPVPDSVYLAATKPLKPASAVPANLKDDPDAGIVTDIPSAPNEFPAGTTFRARMHQTLSTNETQPGSPFTAELVEPIQKDGRILIPAGTTLEGRVTEVRGGRRIHGSAALHLEPRKLTLPDGSHYDIHAQVSDTDQQFATRVDREGSIIRRDHIKTTLGVLGATTGASAVAGAMIGGGVGAAVGAGVGAGIATAWWLKQDRQTTLPKDTAVVFTLNEPIAVGTINR